MGSYVVRVLGRHIWVGWHAIIVVHDLHWHAGYGDKLVHLWIECVSLHAIRRLCDWGELRLYETTKHIVKLWKV